MALDMQNNHQIIREKHWSQLVSAKTQTHKVETLHKVETKQSTDRGTVSQLALVVQFSLKNIAT
jgi:hypothetical protein